MRLIDADKFLSIMKVLNCNLLNLKDIENYIKIYGTVDPEILREHGKWEECATYKGKKYYRCSVCGYYYPINENTRYCQHCDAKMDLEVM